MKKTEFGFALSIIVIIFAVVAITSFGIYYYLTVISPNATPASQTIDLPSGNADQKNRIPGKQSLADLENELNAINPDVNTETFSASDIAGL